MLQIHVLSTGFAESFIMDGKVQLMWYFTTKMQDLVMYKYTMTTQQQQMYKYRTMMKVHHMILE
jgi:hypothetical protein